MAPPGFTFAGRAQLVARFAGTGGGHTLLLNGHVVVAGPRETLSGEPFEAVVRDGALHGMGLYRGLELVSDREARTPACQEAYAICGRLLELGVVIQPTGPDANVLKIKPPLYITREDVDFFADALEHALSTGW